MTKLQYYDNVKTRMIPFFRTLTLLILSIARLELGYVEKRETIAEKELIVDTGKEQEILLNNNNNSNDFHVKPYEILKTAFSGNRMKDAISFSYIYDLPAGPEAFSWKIYGSKNIEANKIR